jgi:hypothetical protein
MLEIQVDSCPHSQHNFILTEIDGKGEILYCTKCGGVRLLRECVVEARKLEAAKK